MNCIRPKHTIDINNLFNYKMNLISVLNLISFLIAARTTFWIDVILFVYLIENIFNYFNNLLLQLLALFKKKL